MHIYLAADHNGLKLKDALRDWLKSEGKKVTDLGPDVYDQNDDYPDFGIQVARAVASRPEENVGILVCGSGVGMAVVADKVKGVRAGLIHDPAIAQAARRDDDINVLALGARFISAAGAKRVVMAWLQEKFSGAERHRRRIDKIIKLENEQGR
ncbi:MAG: RpiB/LacA/LacB family sugar-phosphate isomerase [Candidatus Andersenbacteria bacterium]|nr:RpiB/LacA/LacB family sugar-phosphate isomerase [Candidatus Andersenbacteria bacterium]